MFSSVLFFTNTVNPKYLITRTNLNQFLIHLSKHTGLNLQKHFVKHLGLITTVYFILFSYHVQRVKLIKNSYK